MTDSLHSLPVNLPAPEADGACDHLLGMHLPWVSLPSTSAFPVDLSGKPGRTVLYIYPMTGHPDRPLPTDWDVIPGARGCTPQACAFRDHYQELRALNADVFGLSTQSTAEQQEAVTRLQLPFTLLSDVTLDFAEALRLPTFEVDGMTLLKRVTLIVNNGIIEHVFYPVFPPDQNATEVIAWLTANP